MTVPYWQRFPEKFKKCTTETCHQTATINNLCAVHYNQTLKRILSIVRTSDLFQRKDENTESFNSRLIIIINEIYETITEQVRT